MKTSIHHTLDTRVVPVRWYERGWAFSLNPAEETAMPPQRVTARKPVRKPAVPGLRLRKIPVTSRKRFSQPPRAQRHRRTL